MPPRDAPTDAACGLDADALLAPPTEAELRALRGHPLARFARPLLGALAASLVGGILIALAASGPDRDAPRAHQARTTARSAAPSFDDTASPRSRMNGDAPVLFAPAGGFVTVTQAPTPGERTKKAGDGILPDAGSAGRRATRSIADAREDPIPGEPRTARSRPPDGARPRRSLPAAPSPASTLGR